MSQYFLFFFICYLTTSNVATADSICYQPLEVGDCEDITTRYWYNAETGKCESFSYTGCKGNANNFETLGECQNACRELICELQKEVGPCRASQPRFGYNSTTDLCEKFIYGGCKGNGNNFETESDCENLCKYSDYEE